MIVIKNVRTIDGINIQCSIESPEEQIIDAEDKLTLFPALIDSHYHSVDDCEKISKNAVKGGVTTIFALTSSASKIAKIDNSIDCLYYLEFNEEIFQELSNIRGSILGIKIEFLDDETYDRLFRFAAQMNSILLIDLAENNQKEQNVSIKSLKKAISYAEKYNAVLFFLNVHTKEEIDVIDRVKHHGILLYAETTPYYLHSADFSYLWEAIEKGIVDVIGNNTEILLPFLINAYWQKKISLEKIVETTRKNVQIMFEIPQYEDVVLVDLKKEFNISNSFLKEKATTGSPVYTIAKGKVFSF